MGIVLLSFAFTGDIFMAVYGESGRKSGGSKHGSKKESKVEKQENLEGESLISGFLKEIGVQRVIFDTDVSRSLCREIGNQTTGDRTTFFFVFTGDIFTVMKIAERAWIRRGGKKRKSFRKKAINFEIGILK